MNAFFPLQKLLRLMFGIAIAYQIIIILYNHFSGFYPLVSGASFLFRLFKGILYSTIAGVLMAIPDLMIIRYLNQFYKWETKVLSRITIQLFFTVFIASVVSIPLTIFNNWITPYPMGLWTIVSVNLIIYIIINLMTMILLEAWLFFIESDKAMAKANNLEKELAQMRFEVLKSQINPHFMFNSLNVLSGLIEKDINKAQQFIDEFSLIYRYVLETIEKPIVLLNEELRFVRSYIFLQQIRYGEALILNINLPSSLLKMLLPPLSLQTVLENAIKHNVVNASQPLQIDIFFESDRLVVKNNIQPKISSNISTGVGQSNMVKRYSIIGENIPNFIVETNHYIVKLPLIKNEDNESINY